MGFGSFGQRNSEAFAVPKGSSRGGWGAPAGASTVGKAFGFFRRPIHGGPVRRGRCWRFRRFSVFRKPPGQSAKGSFFGFQWWGVCPFAEKGAALVPLAQPPKPSFAFVLWPRSFRQRLAFVFGGFGRRWRRFPLPHWLYLIKGNRNGRGPFFSPRWPGTFFLEGFAKCHVFSWQAARALASVVIFAPLGAAMPPKATEGAPPPQCSGGGLWVALTRLSKSFGLENALSTPSGFRLGYAAPLPQRRPLGWKDGLAF